MAVTVALADDHPLVRVGLRAVVEAEPEFHLIGETGDGLEAIQFIERARPDVLVVDLMMPGLSGLEVIRQASRRAPGTRIVVLSMHANEAYVLEALKHGAAAYVLKDASARDLIQAIREAAAGRRFLSAPLSERAMAAYLEKAEGTIADAYETLTDREREVLHLAAQGYSNPTIADRLSISPRTAETHRTNLMRKLELRSQTELIRYALRRGILPLEG
jgi:two-component system, NarL family, response regulator NreC